MGILATMLLLSIVSADNAEFIERRMSFNAQCCHHNGHTADTRGRGGLISNPDGGVSYHCFNCGFKASWQPGRNFSHKLRKLLQWMGAPDDVINKVALEVMRENEGVEAKTIVSQLQTLQTLTSIVWQYLNIWLHVI